MKQLPTDDDERLVEFLKANRPDVPSAAPDLEARIFQAVKSEPSLNVRRFSKRLWLFPPAIAAGLMLVWGNNMLRSGLNTLPFQLPLQVSRTSTTTMPNDAELVKLESFLENNWNSVVASSQTEEELENTSADWMQLANTTAQNSTKSTLRETTRR
ncbi:hypothetical protein [Argonema antarcticum]|uniref:hypothetical protein n=1 Tax=Argonema antarcticum TaxID=2942763 RepID=UPI0020128350|nr:hypothetical protein [Argonema antarcticum]MCL1472336.1 hypothetical protein [Argonema antarcticum A004/B2]